jgi:hypothetical protein
MFRSETARKEIHPEVTPCGFFGRCPRRAGNRARRGKRRVLARGSPKKMHEGYVTTVTRARLTGRADAP